MQVAVKLQESFSYFPVIFLIIVGIIGTLLILFLPIIKPKKRKTPRLRPVQPQNILRLKEKYIRLLNDIEQNHVSGRTTERQALQALSKTVRNFVHAATGIRVQNYTLVEIHAAGMPCLYELISQCYIPEFAVDSHADVCELIKKARMVISEWN